MLRRIKKRFYQFIIPFVISLYRRFDYRPLIVCLFVRYESSSKRLSSLRLLDHFNRVSYPKCLELSVDVRLWVLDCGYSTLCISLYLFHFVYSTLCIPMFDSVRLYVLHSVPLSTCSTLDRVVSTRFLISQPHFWRRASNLVQLRCFEYRAIRMRISAFRSCSLRKHPAVSSTFLLCATRSSDTSELILSFRVVAEPLQSFRVVSEPLPSFRVVFQSLQSLFRAS